jgi:hypothetical protein
MINSTRLDSELDGALDVKDDGGLLCREEN